MPPAEDDASMAGDCGQLGAAVGGGGVGGAGAGTPGPPPMAASPWPCCADSDIAEVEPCCPAADCRRHSATTLNSLSSCAYKGNFPSNCFFNRC